MIVGVGQLTRRPGGSGGGPAGDAAGRGPAGGETAGGTDDRSGEPVRLMAAALERAARDAGAGPALLARAQRVAVVSVLSWPYPNPALLLAELIGAGPGGSGTAADLVLTTAGGNSPQMLVHRVAADIAAGRLDVAVIAGAESMYSRRRAREMGGGPHWTSQPESTPTPRLEGDGRPGSSGAEGAASLLLPVQYYPLFENALRHAAGRSIDDHQVHVSELWARFSDVAAGNPHAWSPVPRRAAEIRTVTAGNRMVGFPYTKYMNANLTVDQAAGMVVCSVEAARRAGVPEDRWVFPRSGAEAHDHWFVSERADLTSSPAIRLSGRRALELDGADIGGVAHVDLYSCFPAPVEIAAAELGMGTDEPDRPLTVTGGLGFAGGPGNNYVTHSIAAMCDVLRRDPGSLGMVTALGWYITKHAIGLYSTTPPAAGFRWESVQPAVDALPRREVVPDAEGPAVVETYTVMHERDGSRTTGHLVCRLPDGRRALAGTTDPGTLESLTASEGCGRAVRLLGGAKAELA